MANIDIESIQNVKLKQVANQVDKMGIGEKKGEIEESEVPVFESAAKQLLKTDDISEQDYTAIFGLKVSQPEQEIPNSSADTNMVEKPSNEQEPHNRIQALEQQEKEIKKELYGILSSDVFNDLYTSMNTLAFTVLAVSLKMALGKTPFKSKGTAIAGVCGLAAGAEGTPLFIHHLKEKQEAKNPELYQKLQDVKQQLADLKKA